MIIQVNPLIAVGVLASTATTDAAYVFFNAAVSGRQRAERKRVEKTCEGPIVVIDWLMAVGNLR